MGTSLSWVREGMHLWGRLVMRKGSALMRRTFCKEKEKILLWGIEGNALVRKRKLCICKEDILLGRKEMHLCGREGSIFVRKICHEEKKSSGREDQSWERGEYPHCEEENNLWGRFFMRKSRKCTFVDNHEEEKARNLLRGKRKKNARGLKKIYSWGWDVLVKSWERIKFVYEEVYCEEMKVYSCLYWGRQEYKIQNTRNGIFS